jgi:hypothetical protein
MVMSMIVLQCVVSESKSRNCYTRKRLLREVGWIVDRVLLLISAEIK